MSFVTLTSLKPIIFILYQQGIDKANRNRIAKSNQIKEFNPRWTSLNGNTFSKVHIPEVYSQDSHYCTMQSVHVYTMSCKDTSTDSHCKNPCCTKLGSVITPKRYFDM